MAHARACGGRVRIDGDVSPTNDAYALPDGQIQLTTALAPVRVREADGTWAPVDLTLRADAAGTVVPARSAFIARFSGAAGAGEHQLAAVGLGSDEVAIRWNGPLPAPRLSGNTATYPDVKPGVDLVLSVTAAGIEQNVVITSRRGIRELPGIALPLVSHTGAASAPDAAGSVAFRDHTGRVFARVAGMRMWDAATDARTGQPDRRPLAAIFTPLAASGTRPAGTSMAFAPDQRWLEDPARTFPITLDPAINPELTTFDTFVRQGSSTDYGGYGDLELGTTSGDITRSFLSWNMTGLQHAAISAATVYFFNWYSQSCTATPWELWLTSTANTTPATTWATQPAKIKKEATSTATHGYSSSCDDGWSSIDGKNFFQDAADTGSDRGYMELVASDESLTSIGFKQFRSRNAADPNQVPYAVVTYTSTPVIGTRSTTPPTACTTGPARPFVNTKTPTLKAVITQADGATSTANFEWWTVAGTKVGGAAVTGVVSGHTASATIPSSALADGSSYKWRVEAVSGAAASAWSGYCEFTVDIVAPSAAPTVSSAQYPANTWSGSAGTPGTFTLAANGVTDVSSYRYGLDANPPQTNIAAPSLGAAATVTLTPATNGAHVLYVQSIDRAGNVSPLTAYAFNVGGAAVSLPAEGTVTAGLTQLQGAAPAGSTGVTYQWRRADTDPWMTIPTGDVTYAQGGAPVAFWPVTVTGGTHPTLNWSVKQSLANSNTPAGVTGRWQLNETSGTTAADSSNHAHPATTTAVTWSGDHSGSAVLNGTTSQAVTSGPVVATAASFTVTAWVNLAGTTANSIAVSQNGTQQSGFDLRYNKSTNKWTFGRWNADIVNAPTFLTASSAAGAPVAGAWTHLAGTYDATTGLMTLYVDGVAQTNTGTDTTPISATGAFVIGHGEFNNGATGWFNGSIADVQAYDRVLTAAQINSLVTGASGNTVALAGPVQVRATFAGSGASSPQTGFTFDPNLATGATADMGPVTVNLVTGDALMSATDVDIAASGTNLTVARSFNSRQAGAFDASHMFGPGWSSTATIMDSSSPYTSLSVAGSLIQVRMADGSTVGFTAATATTFTPQIGQEDLHLTYTSATDLYTLTTIAGTKVVFQRVTGSAAGQYAPKSVTQPGSTASPSMSWTTATTDGVTVIRPTRLLAATPTGISCTTLVRGCRALDLTYAITTTATGSTWGDYIGRLQQVSFTAWNPATAAMTTTVVARYQYDLTGRLTAAWDPRQDNGPTHLWRTYAYNTDGTIATTTPAGQLPWILGYTTIPGDIGQGRLATVSRSALSAGTATITAVYNVPLSGSGAPYDLSSAQTTRWGQSQQPVQATAIFDPGQQPTGNQATGSMPSSWTRATIHYLDANSRLTNVATPGGHTSATWYDVHGNTIQSLSAANRARALADSTTDTSAQEAALAALYSNTGIYSADGTRLLSALGPQHSLMLSDGSVVDGRDAVFNTYDENAQAPCHAAWSPRARAVCSTRTAPVSPPWPTCVPPPRPTSGRWGSPRPKRSIRARRGT